MPTNRRKTEAVNVSIYLSPTARVFLLRELFCALETDGVEGLFSSVLYLNSNSTEGNFSNFPRVGDFWRFNGLFPKLAL